jgi:hypothetical protein
MSLAVWSDFKYCSKVSCFRLAMVDRLTNLPKESCSSMFLYFTRQGVYDYGFAGYAALLGRLGEMAM